MNPSLKSTSSWLQGLGITGPTVVVDQTRAEQNIRDMTDRARHSGALFRPHFKTHQSGAVGRWFARAGTEAITVSSLGMAEYFAEFGWLDITLAFLVNPLEIPRLLDLAQFLEERGGRLGLTIDSAEVAGQLARAHFNGNIWIKVDTGYGRTGASWNDGSGLREIRAALEPDRHPAGLLSHTGNSYRSSSNQDRQTLWDTAVQRLNQAREELGPAAGMKISLGDTPCCWTVESLAGADEVRPGNFVFFDLMQLELGVCPESRLAAAVACPVVGIYPDQSRLVVHGGAVHLSREYLGARGRREIFGKLGFMASNTDLGGVLPDAEVVSLSQEHGVITLESPALSAQLRELKIGDLVLVWPVHSCLTCEQFSSYLTLEGTVLERR